MNFTFLIAYRYFRSKNKDKLISVISGFSLVGVTLGVAALIIVSSVMNGFRKELIKSMIGLSSDIVVTSSNGKIEKYDEVINSIKSIKGVNESYPVIVGQSLAIAKKATTGVLVKSFRPHDLLQKKQIANNIVAGSIENFNSLNGIAIGLDLAMNLGVNVGDSIKMISPNTINSALGMLPRSKDFTIKAIFHSKLYEFDAATIIMPFEIASKYFMTYSAVNLIEVYVDNSFEADKYMELIFSKLGGNYQVSSWLMNNAQFLNALKVESTVMSTILSLIIMVAAFNIVSSLFMLVKDKSKDIAILKTIGATSKQISAIFIIMGGMIGVIGTATGVIIGVLFSLNLERIRSLIESLFQVELFDPSVYMLSSLPSELSISSIVWTSIISLSLSIFSALYPAYKAATLDPIEIIRNE